MTSIVRAGLLVAALSASLWPDAAFAQEAPAEQAQPSAAGRTFPVVPPQKAEDTRQQLHTILQLYAPNLRRVLQADPSLLERADYLSPYPQLIEFLKQHPEVTRNPAFYFGVYEDYWNRPSSASELFAGVLAGTAAFIGGMTILLVIASLGKQAIEYRRWLRQSRVQAEVHTKILDRMGSNEELLGYIESPAGRRFLEATPIAVDGEPRSINAPVGRILWSVQIGVVLATLGVGLWLVRPNVPDEIAAAFYVMTVVAVSLGVGAVISAAVAYVLSARLGLLPAKQAS